MKVDIFYRGEYQWSTEKFNTKEHALIDAVYAYTRRGFSLDEVLRVKAYIDHGRIR